MRKISIYHLHELWEWNAVKLGLLWRLLSKNLSVPYRHYSWGNESLSTSTQSQNMPVPNQEKRQNSCLYCLLQRDAALPIATVREILICVSCFLLSHCDSLLYIHCDRGKYITDLLLLLDPCHRASIHQCHHAKRRAVDICLHPERKRVSSPLRSDQM